MNIDVAQFSDAGPRQNNEDAVLALDLGNGRAILAVADGLGGHFGGKEASQIAVDSIKSAGFGSDLQQVLFNAHSNIAEAARSNDSLKGMATTATAVEIDGTTLRGAHCGDTRCVVQRGSGIRKLTTEHTEARRLFESGKLTKTEFLKYPRRNILYQALGADKEPVIDNFDFALQAGDKILITSDGVHEKLLMREMLQICLQSESVDAIASNIREAILLRSPEDNFSVVVARVH
jgi:PPM family protein phosphatase